jgi:hypothetical protein
VTLEELFWRRAVGSRALVRQGLLARWLEPNNAGELRFLAEWEVSLVAGLGRASAVPARALAGLGLRDSSEVEEEVEVGRNVGVGCCCCGQLRLGLGLGLGLGLSLSLGLCLLLLLLGQVLLLLLQLLLLLLMLLLCAPASGASITPCCASAPAISSWMSPIDAP